MIGDERAFWERILQGIRKKQYVEECEEEESHEVRGCQMKRGIEVRRGKMMMKVERMLFDDRIEYMTTVKRKMKRRTVIRSG
jgi:hypothetical protein